MYINMYIAVGLSHLSRIWTMVENLDLS